MRHVFEVEGLCLRIVRQRSDEGHQRRERGRLEIAMPVVVLALGANHIEGSEHAQRGSRDELAHGRILQVECFKHLAQLCVGAVIVGAHP